MTITLLGRQFRLVRTVAGAPVVLIRVNRRLARIASPRDTARVLAGLRVAALRAVS